MFCFWHVKLNRGIYFENQKSYLKIDDKLSQVNCEMVRVSLSWSVKKKHKNYSAQAYLQNSPSHNKK